MVSELFIHVFEHICALTCCSSEHPILLLLDNHVSHTSLEAIIYVKENGIVILSFPPHCSHRLQPLDVGVFGPFKISMNNVHASYPGKYDIAGISKVAFFLPLRWKIYSLYLKRHDYGLYINLYSVMMIFQLHMSLIVRILNEEMKVLNLHKLQ